MRAAPALLLIAAMSVAATAPAAPPLEVRWIPVVAQVPGFDDNYWNTEVWLTNLSRGEGWWHITFLPAGEDNTERLLTEPAPRPVPPGETLYLKDVVPPDSTGALRVGVSEGVEVRCRLYNANAGGASGEMIPTLREHELIHPGEVGHLGPLLRSSQFRTNLGILNPNPRPIQVRAAIVDDRGVEVARVTYPMAPGSQGQVNDVLLTQRIEQADGYQVMVSSEDVFAAYAAIVDTRSGMPTLLLPVKR